MLPSLSRTYMIVSTATSTMGIDTEDESVAGIRPARRGAAKRTENKIRQGQRQELRCGRIDGNRHKAKTTKTASDERQNELHGTGTDLLGRICKKGTAESTDDNLRHELT